MYGYKVVHIFGVLPFFRNNIQLKNEEQNYGTFYELTANCLKQH